ncbi:LegC family aminotransferase [Salidesulfovibrio brasiliensis]|uniref:LegC family aminotransferase n=1 Tax=Salidesulfovibrio brasiliensis TaxID=221711 RepID=UPI0006D24E97|nr:LegC family aminotransferase [Salidesulfovibrio brasiliensis]
MDVARQALDRMQQVLPQEGFIPLHEPTFGGAETELLIKCVESTFVSSVGAYVDEFERRLAEFTGAARAVAVVNGTAALQVALDVCGVERGDEVLMPALTFVATANAASYLGAVPHFVDSEEHTFGVDPVRLREHLVSAAEVRDGVCLNRSTGRPIRALVPVHVFGHPCDVEALAEVCDDYSITLVEDAAESLGSWRDGTHTGRFGRCSAVSFNGNKIITTGGGGAVLTNDEALADRIRHLTTTAKVPHKWEYRHDAAGYNFRMPNINAALGCAQMDQLEGFIAAKRTLAERYAQAFDGLDGVRFVTEPAGCRSNYWLNAVLLEGDAVATREAILETTNAAGYMTRPAWQLMHRLPMYEACPRMELPVAERLEAGVINLPSGAGL